MTIKQIAQKLNLSPRTVEHYIDTIKGKLNCYSRDELVTKALQLQSIKNALLKI
jgi:DNA-binding NarL/FixJ family response regulator